MQTTGDSMTRPWKRQRLGSAGLFDEDRDQLDDLNVEDNSQRTAAAEKAGPSTTHHRHHHDDDAPPHSLPQPSQLEISKVPSSPVPLPLKNKGKNKGQGKEHDKGKNKGKGKGKATAISLSPILPPTPSHPKSPAEPLSEYTCPICFFPPSNATLTPCGHVCCGSCLFTAVKTTLHRGASMGVAINTGENVPRCPVCRAVIRCWDGRGGGVIGLKVRIQ